MSPAVPDRFSLTGLPRDPVDRAHEIQLRLADAHTEIADVNARVAAAVGRGVTPSSALTDRAKELADVIARLGSVAGGAQLTPAARRIAALNGRRPVDDPAQLAGSTPVALLPVRVETRFIRGTAPQLLVRIYPDDIHANRHEPELTQDEETWGRSYWTQIFTVAPTSTTAVDAWRSLASRFGPARAAWIAVATRPSNYPPRVRRGGAVPPPSFPAVTRRAGPWTRPATSGTIPDRWLVLLYTGNQRVITASSAILPDPLQVGPSPAVSSPTVTGGKASLDPGAAWLSDFDAAVATGMGIRVPISASQAQKGFDLLLVLGVKSTIAPAEGATRLGAALDAHHYTGGLSFVPPGTPTNATEQDRPPAGTPETIDLPSFGIERGGALASDPASDGGRLARLTGIQPTAFDHVAGADAAGDTDARLMNTLLWPATFGYVLWQLTDPLVDDTGRDAARSFFATYVRARGPLPALRVGNQPYGVLPVTSLDRWQPAAGDSTAAGIAKLARGLRAAWRSSAGNVPRAGVGDPDDALLGMLGMAPNASAVNARVAVSREYAFDTAWFYGLDPGAADWDAIRASVEAQLAAAAGPGLASVALAELGLDPTFASVLDAPWVIDEKRPLLTAPEEYLQRVAAFEPMQLWNIHSLFDFTPVPLLAVLARHAVLREYAEAAARKLGITGANRHDRVLVGIPSATPQARDWLNTAVKRSTVTIGDRLHAGGRGGDARLEEVRAAASALAHVDPVRLELLLRETLGLSAGRLDAWITALATKRLQDGRDAGAAGIHLGAYGWVERLRPDTSARKVRPPKGEPRNLEVWHSSANAGHVHAPSLEHAATAAILRSGYLSHAAAGHGDAVAVDLTSERVREAAWLLDGVRQGQPLGALLGYRFERALHERHQGLDLDKCIAPLRALEPIQGGKLTDRGGHPAEAIAAANVVDGLRLLRRWQSGPTGIPFGNGSLPSATSPEGAAIVEELNRLATLVDGLGDAILAESVHHLTTGRPEAAAGSLDALSRGDTPPPAELDVARTPRRGTGQAHRAAVLLRGSITGGGWSTGPRAKLEPALEAWTATLLPDPADVACTVKLFDAAGQPLPDARVRLGDLGISALDFVYAAVPGEAAEASEIELRAVLAALAGTAGAVRAEVRFDDLAGAPTGFPSALWQAAELRALLDTCRPLLPADLVEPGTAAAAPDVAELTQRLNGLVTDMNTTAASLAAELRRRRPGPRPPTLRNLLFTLARYGVRSTVPVSDSGDAAASRGELVERAGAALVQFQDRAKALAAAVAAGGDWNALADAGRTALGTTIRLLPRFDPGYGTALDTAIAGSAALLDGDAAAADDFLLDASLVRAPVSRLTSVLTAGRSMRATVAELAGADFAVAQLPLRAGDRWVGLPLTAGARPEGGRVSLLLHAPDLGGTGNRVAGLFVDEWLEVIPEPDVATGLSFHHTAPVAAPPQAVLLAAPPARQAAWSLDALEAVLLETLELAKLRLVDLDALGTGGALAPAAWFAYNTKDDTVSTDFTVAMRGP